MDFRNNNQFQKFITSIILIFTLSFLFSNVFFIQNNKFETAKASVKTVNVKAAKKSSKKPKHKKTA